MGAILGKFMTFKVGQIVKIEITREKDCWWYNLDGSDKITHGMNNTSGRLKYLVGEIIRRGIEDDEYQGNTYTLKVGKKYFPWISERSIIIDYIATLKHIRKNAKRKLINR